MGTFCCKRRTLMNMRTQKLYKMFCEQCQRQKYLCVATMSIATHLCGSFLDHFQLTLVDLDTPKEPIKEPEEDPTSQPEQTQGAKMQKK